MASGLAHPQWNNGDVTDGALVDLDAVRAWYRNLGVPWGLRVPAGAPWAHGRLLFRKRLMGLTRLTPAADVPGLVVRAATTSDLDAVLHVDSIAFDSEPATERPWIEPHLSADRDFINMLVKEAKLTGLLNHPNIVQVYDLAKEGDEYYIAMEYVPGVTVGAILEYCRKGGILLPPEVPVHITAQLLRGLAYAHNLTDVNGEKLAILHRDITPQNILVSRRAFVSPKAS